MKLVVAALLALSLSACQVTVLEALPTGATRACPDELRGGFLGLDADDRSDEAFAVFVESTTSGSSESSKRDAKDAPATSTAGCTFHVYERTEGPAVQPVALSPSFLSVPGNRVLLLSNEDVAKVLRPSASDAPTPRGFIPFAWSRDDDLLTLAAPDHRRIATLIVNGAIDGETHWTGRDSGSNLLRGTPDALRDRLMHDQLFVMRSDTKLRHVGASRRELERALAKASKAAHGESEQD